MCISVVCIDFGWVYDFMYFIFLNYVLVLFNVKYGSNYWLYGICKLW